VQQQQQQQQRLRRRQESPLDLRQQQKDQFREHCRRFKVNFPCKVTCSIQSQILLRISVTTAYLLQLVAA
jgi:hypothetical protein